MSSGALGPLAPDLTCVELDGRVCAYAPRTQQVVVLNETATAVLRLVDGSRSSDDVVEALAVDYGLPPEEIRPDVLTVLQAFRRDGLLGPA